MKDPGTVLTGTVTYILQVPRYVPPAAPKSPVRWSLEPKSCQSVNLGT